MAIVNGLTTLADVKNLLGIAPAETSQDARLEMLINMSSARIGQYCNRQFKRQNYTETLPPNGRQLLILQQYPVQSVASVVQKGTTLTAATDYIATSPFAEVGEIYRETGWTGDYMLRGIVTNDIGPGKLEIVVTYVAGYYLPDDALYVAGNVASLPLDLQYACQLMTASDFMQARRNNFDGLSGLTEGGLSYQWGGKNGQSMNNNSGFTQETAGILNRYRRIAIA